MEFSKVFLKAKRKIKMSKLTAIITAAVIALISVALVFPSIRGPFNRAKHKINDKLSYEYVIDNCKEEYVKLFSKKDDVIKSIQNLTIDKKVSEKKLSVVESEIDNIKTKLREIDVSNIEEFRILKSIYEGKLVETNNLNTVINTYNNSIQVLKKALDRINNKLCNYKINIQTLESKKSSTDNISEINKIIKNLDGIGNSDISIPLEELNEKFELESITNEVLSDDKDVDTTLTEIDVKNYINNL